MIEPVLRQGWWVPKSDRVSLRIVLDESVDVTKIVEACGTRRRAVQAGGHVGIWPLALSTLFQNVTTCEPEPSNYAAMVKNLSETTNVEARMCVLGQCAGRVGMNRAFRGNDGAHRVADGDECEVITVDSLGYDDVDLIQLDVEGYELFALRGAEETIRRCKPVVCVELKGLSLVYGIEDYETVAYLTNLGYQKAFRVRQDVVFTHRA